MKRLTVKGDLDGAVALRDKIKNLETEAVKKTEPKKLNEIIILSWSSHGTVLLLPNGVLSSTWGKGSWVKGNNDDVFIAIFGGGQQEHTVKLNRKSMTFTSVRDDNDKINGTFMIP